MEYITKFQRIFGISFNTYICTLKRRAAQGQGGKGRCRRIELALTYLSPYICVKLKHLQQRALQSKYRISDSGICLLIYYPLLACAFWRKSNAEDSLSCNLSKNCTFIYEVLINSVFCNPPPPTQNTHTDYRSLSLSLFSLSLSLSLSLSAPAPACLSVLCYLCLYCVICVCTVIPVYVMLYLCLYYVISVCGMCTVQVTVFNKALSDVRKLVVPSVVITWRQVRNTSVSVVCYLECCLWFLEMKATGGRKRY